MNTSVNQFLRLLVNIIANNAEGFIRSNEQSLPIEFILISEPNELSLRKREEFHRHVPNRNSKSLNEFQLIFLIHLLLIEFIILLKYCGI